MNDFLMQSARTMKLYHHLFKTMLAQTSLTQMEMDILLFLHHHPIHDTAKDMVEMRRLSKSHVSLAVESLVQKGYLERKKEADNRKTIHLKLLPDAQEVIAMGVACQKRFYAMLFDGFSVAEMERMQQQWCRIGKNVDSAFEKERI